MKFVYLRDREEYVRLDRVASAIEDGDDLRLYSDDGEVLGTTSDYLWRKATAHIVPATPGQVLVRRFLHSERDFEFDIIAWMIDDVFVRPLLEGEFEPLDLGFRQLDRDAFLTAVRQPGGRLGLGTEGTYDSMEQAVGALRAAVER